MEHKSGFTVCYFGITDPDFTRTRVHIEALRAQGITVLECFDSSPGILKFVRLFQKHRLMRRRYDALVVGAASSIVVPFARFICRTPIIFDAGWSLYEGVVISRGRYARNVLGRAYVWIIDWLAANGAHLILLETEAQADFYSRLLGIPRAKCRRLFTGVDESRFRFFDIPKRGEFTVLFRGKWMAEAGIEHAIEAARLLEHENIRFYIMSPGYVPRDPSPLNTEIDPRFYPSWDELCEKMLQCHISLGQLEAHERLKRTIPHKAFESMALRLPYITARATGIAELLTDGVDCLMVDPASPSDLAQKIRLLAADPERLRELAERAWQTYQAQCSNRVLGTTLAAIISDCIASFS